MSLSKEHVRCRCHPAWSKPWSADGRAIVFTGATRNSLVVLPLALALPDTLAVAAVVVVTQTLVEVIGMVVYVRTVPRLLPAPSARPRAGQG